MLDPEKPTTWTAPPIPPIPTEQEEEAWRRRSLKRQSYTSQISCGSIHNDTQSLVVDVEKAVLKPTSHISTTSTSRWQLPRPGRPVHGDLQWDVNTLNPKNWRRRKKWAHTLVAAAVTFTITLASSIVTPARQYLASGRDVSSTVATLPLSLFLLGLSLGPFIGRCCTTVFGRKIIYIIFVLLFAIFTLIAGLVDTIYGILICRAFAGLLAGPALSQGGGMIAEMWALEHRTEALLVCDAMFFVGPVVGVVIGGYIQWGEKYSWTRYVVLFASAACIVPIVLVSETSRKVIEWRQQRHSVTHVADERTVRTALLEPARLLYKRPAALVLSLQSGFVFALLYASFVAFPSAFANAHAFNTGSQSLTFLSMLIGIAVGSAILLLSHKLLYTPRVEQWQAHRAAEAEKARRTSARLVRRYTSRLPAPAPKRFDMSDKSASPPVSSRTMSRPVSKGDAFGHERDNNLATAAAKYLNDLEANKDNQIEPRVIAQLLGTHPAFGDLCAALRELRAHFDTVQLAKALVDGLPPPATSNGSALLSSRGGLFRSTSLHRSAAAANANDGTARQASPPGVPRLPTYHTPAAEYEAQRGPPAKWRLYPALPASALLPVALFLVAWTARSSIHWAVPCIGMGVFACSAVLICVSSQLYLMDRYGAGNGASMLAGTMSFEYMMSFGLTLIVVPMYERLGVAWATSVLGFIGLMLCVVPWMLVFVKKRL
ncbi:hypothetical protein LTR53_007000 [Teratosphaeriaceae sp. CCFEE 6253]|nr:hypothetical protein LTR53_007000 [Teratosphaeriaceae sp. CCFEE 6253]